MTQYSIEHVSDTAFLVAHARSLEAMRRDPLYHDSLAGRVAGEKGKAIFEAFPTSAMTAWTVVLRTVIIDDFIREAASRGVRTVLSLGAGLDTRPYRADLPNSLRWVEVDYPDVIAFKEERLKDDTPLVKLERIGLDLADDEARRDMLAKVATGPGPILVLTEGFVPYLDEAQVGTLADDLRTMPGVDGWIVDYISAAIHAYRDRHGQSEATRQAPFKFRPDDWFGFFAGHGWSPREARYYTDESRRVHRSIPLPWRMKLMILIATPFMSRARRQSLRRTGGYVLLQPTARP